MTPEGKSLEVGILISHDFEPASSLGMNVPAPYPYIAILYLCVNTRKT